MLSSALKSKIRQLWDAFWAGGVANPLTAIEQITYLVFIKRLDDLDREREVAARNAKMPYKSIFDFQADDKRNLLDGEKYRWSYIKVLPAEERFDHMRRFVFDWLKALEGDDQERMRDAVFLIPNANLLTRAVSILDELFIPDRNQDTLGDIYENLLGEIASAGKNGQFRTPRHIIRAMCDLVDVKYGDRVCDPACGTGGFLVNAYIHILQNHTSSDIIKFAADGTPLYTIGDQLTSEEHLELRRNHLYGFDFDRTMVRLGWMNLIQHGLDNPQINYADSLGSKFNERVSEGGDLYESFDVVLANPPFTGNIDKSDIGETLRSLGTNKTELLFVDLIIQLLKPGGRAAVIVPDGVLFGKSRSHNILRKKLVDQTQLHAVISLPGGVFLPYAAVKTSILVFTKGGQTNDVWFYELEKDGYSLSTKRDEQLERNDLWDLSIKYYLKYYQRAPKFIKGKDWDEWMMIKEDFYNNYAQPVISSDLIPEDTNSVEVKVLEKIIREKIDNENSWVVNINSILEQNLNLTTGRYKKYSPLFHEYQKPPLIIIQLQEIEKQIQEDLANLSKMIEGKE
jgi:type I restriction enzyme M protein